MLPPKSSGLQSVCFSAVPLRRQAQASASSLSCNASYEDSWEEKGSAINYLSVAAVIFGPGEARLLRRSARRSVVHPLLLEIVGHLHRQVGLAHPNRPLIINDERFLAEPTMGGSLGLKGFVVSVIGGFGNLPGAVIGGLFLGLIETFGARYISSNFRDAYAFIVMIAVLVAWPRGLFGEKSSEKV
jgi:Branched-chain amino acid transport system / permease component